MDILGRKEKKRKREQAEQRKHELALTEEQQPESPVMTEDYVASLGRSVYMIMDPDVTNLLTPEERPAYSHLNRVTRINEKEARLQMLDYEFLAIVDKLNTRRDKYQAKGWKRSLSLRIYARSIVWDAYQGWKGTIVTEQIKRVAIETEKKKGRFS